MKQKMLWMCCWAVLGTAGQALAHTEARAGSERCTVSEAQQYIRKEANNVKEVMRASVEDLDHSFRGFGIGESTDLSTAKTISMLKAKQDVVIKAQAAFAMALDRMANVMSKATQERVKELFQDRGVGQMRRVKTVCYYMEMGNTNQFAVCIEVDAEDLCSPVEEILLALTVREREEVLKATRTVGFDRVQNTEDIAQTGANLAGHLIHRVVNHCLGQ